MGMEEQLQALILFVSDNMITEWEKRNMSMKTDLLKNNREVEKMWAVRKR